jgi:hypothetical protein
VHLTVLGLDVAAPAAGTIAIAIVPAANAAPMIDVPRRGRITTRR